MLKILTAAEMREVDRLTTEKYGIPSIILMENAAHAVAQVITEKLGDSVKGKSILILCGKGNNGGDGAALARKLGLDGAFVNVVLLGRIQETEGDARSNFGVLFQEEFTYTDVYLSEFCHLWEVNSKEEWNSIQMEMFDGLDLIVDAIFGTGLTRPLEIWTYNIVHEINFLTDDYSRKVPLRLAVDIPSGLNADSGEQLDLALKSDFTVTLTSPKPGNVLPGAAFFNGELIVKQIGTPLELIDEQPSQLYLAEQEDAVEWLRASRFSSDSYKNKRGHALVVAGSKDYSGAAVLAGNAAMRCGVGLVTVVTPRSSKESVSARIMSEVMVRGVEETESGSISSGGSST
jgi:yjeF N-terminal region